MNPTNIHAHAHTHTDLYKHPILYLCIMCTLFLPFEASRTLLSTISLSFLPLALLFSLPNLLSLVRSLAHCLSFFFYVCYNQFCARFLVIKYCESLGFRLYVATTRNEFPNRKIITEPTQFAVKWLQNFVHSLSLSSHSFFDSHIWPNSITMRVL